MTRPSTTTRLVPHRSTRRGALGDTTIIPMATGHGEQPGLERRVAEHELEVLDEQEHRAVQRERREREHARRGGEARVAEHAQVDHRLAVCSSQSANAREQHQPGDERADHLGWRPPALSGAWMMAYSRPDEPRIEKSAPSGSSSRFSGVARGGDEEVPEHERDAQIGTFTKNTEPQ